MKRRILSIITALALCLSLCPSVALAATEGNGTEANPWKCGPTGSESSVCATLSDDGKALTISGTGTMKDWSSTDEAPWKNSGITKVTIGDGVTSIGSNAFNGCNALAEITIPESVKSIGVAAFQSCAALRQITIPGNIDAIDYDTFSGCTVLKSVTINGSVGNIKGGAFYGCTVLESVTITGSVGDIQSAAFSGSGINKIEIHGDVGGIGNGAFSGCTSLKSVTIKGSATGVNKSIGYNAFYGCKSLETFTIPSGITSIGSSAFNGCTGLTSVTIPASVTSIGVSAFSGCAALRQITIPGNIDAINSSTFSGCTVLESVTINGSVGDIQSGAFSGCTVLESVTINGSVTGPIQSAFSGCTALKSITIKGSVGDIKDGAFGRCTALNSVTIEGNATGSSKSIGGSAFYGCNSLETFTIPSGITSIGNGAFSGCAALTSVTIPASVTSIGVSAFSGCAALRQITIPGNIDAINSSTFSGCTVLESVTINGSVGDILGGAFSGCTSLKSVTINGNVGDIQSGAFNGCTALKSVTINGSATGSSKSINSGVFTGCKSLETVTIPSGITSIGNGAFYGCAGLTSVTIPESVTTIGGGAFNGCAGLTSVTIPESVTTIEGNAFGGCSGLTSVTYPAGLISSLNLNIPKNAAQYVYGNLTGQVTLASGVPAITVAEGKTLTIPSGATLALEDSTAQLINNGTIQIAAGGSLSGTGTLSGSGTFTTENLTEDMISVPTDLFYNGADRSDELTTALTEALSNVKVPICGKDFTVSGWTLAVEKAADSDLTYTATYTNDSDNTKTVQKTITLLQSGTDLAGKVTTYNGETETTQFSVDDTITVKATPTATGTAPANAAMLTASFTAPATGQMAVFVGDTQVSAPVDAGADGSYTMTVSAADVLRVSGVAPNGNAVPLTAKFVGNGNMADAAGTVEVSISAVAKVEKSGTTTYVGVLGDAFTDGNSDAAVTLLDDVTITETANRLQIGISCTLNLNGRTIRSDINAPALEVTGNGIVTFSGSGKVVSNSDAALYVQGTVVLMGGTSFCSGGADRGAVEVSTGSLSVVHPNVVMENTGSGGYGLLVKGAASVNLGTGKYSGAAGAISVSANGFTLGSLLNQGDTFRFAYYKDNGTLVTEGLDGQTLPGGSYTVRTCAHAYQYTHTTGTATHTKTCPACGDAKAAETCSYDAATGRCACGSTLAVTLPADLALTYDGTAQEPGVTVTVDGQTLAAEKYQINYDNNINAGNTAKVTVTAANGSFSGSVSSTFTIGKASLTIKASDQTITYGGSIAQGPGQVTPTGLCTGDTLESVTLTPSSDQVAVAGKTITPSSAVIKRSGEDVTANYNITYQPGALTIDKAQAAVTGNPTANTLTYTGAAQALVTAGSASIGDVVYSLTETGTYSTTIPTGTDAGSYTVWYKVEGTENYNGTTPVKVDVTIDKAVYSGTKTASTSAKFGATGTYDLSALLPDGATAGTATTTSDIFEGTPEASGKTLTYTLKTGATVGNTGTITVPVTSTNYNDFNLTITVAVTNKDVPTLTVSPITVTYTGQTVPASAIQGTAKVGSTTVPGTWAFASGEAVTSVADSGTKAVKFVPTDKETYAEATGTVVVTINKATPTGAPKYTAISASGKTLADAGLTAVGGTFSTEGTVAWTLDNTTEVTANTQYEWTFTPTDTANYTTLTGKITLWPYTTPVNPGGGGGYVPSDPGSSSLPVTTTGQGSSTVTTTTTATPTASTQGGTATTTINTTMGNEIVKQAVANKSETVVIAPNVTGSVTKAEVSIPASTVEQLGSKTDANLTVSTPVADVVIPNEALGELSKSGGNIGVNAEVKGNTVEFSVTAGGKPVETVPGGVTVTVPLKDTKPGTVAVLVHEDGTREVVRKSVAGDDSITIPLDGSAKLEIVDNSKSFQDVPDTSWEADAVAFASARELFNGTAPGQFSPDEPMTRAMLVTVLARFDGENTSGGSTWYEQGVDWAVSKGISDGSNPGSNITREQLAVMLWRYAGSPVATEKELHFTDADKASGYAQEALRWATEKGIINGKGGGILDPTGQATRAQVAQMLKNYLER